MTLVLSIVVPSSEDSVLPVINVVSADVDMWSFVLDDVITIEVVVSVTSVGDCDVIFADAISVEPTELDDDADSFTNIPISSEIYFKLFLWKVKSSTIGSFDVMCQSKYMNRLSII